MPLASLAATTLLFLVAATVVTVSLVSAARDADWWVITRGTVCGWAARFARRQ